MIFVEPGLGDLASIVFCFKIEGNGLRLAAVTVIFVKAVSVDDVYGVAS
jgi:hypothetical protein